MRRTAEQGNRTPSPLLGGEHIALPLARALARAVSVGCSFDSGWLPLDDYRAARDILTKRIRSGIRQGHIKQPIALVECLRQLAKLQRSRKRALRAAQLELMPDRSKT